MKRIIYHWSGGSYCPNEIDRKHYHYMIDNNGGIFCGIYKVEDNENCLDGVYAAHTGGGNTGSIGIAFLGMFGFSSRLNTGRFPLTKIQCEMGFKLGALLAKKYNLNLNNPLSVQTHYGFGQRNPKTASAGKIDIIYLPPYTDIKKDEIEKFIRNKVTWYFKHLV